jgi:hypothetical protein
MSAVASQWRAGGVAAVYLMHGTFAGADALGLWTAASRFHAGFGQALRSMTKRIVDRTAGDGGNYTDAYATALASAINTGPRNPGATRPNWIDVRRFTWSSENHHIGRADGAIRLLDELREQHFAAGSRVLCWAHSHAGNVLALATNLLGSDRDTLARFFDACRIYYCRPWSGACDLPHWQRVCDWLLDTHPEATGRPRPFVLDVVTFGTPIRYGWETAGYGKLVHIVNHRPRAELDEYRCAYPPHAKDVLVAHDGDYVHQLGIAGTNWAPGPLSLRSWIADVRLGRLVQGAIEPRGLRDRWRCGQRVAEEGTTLLVDYGPPPESIVFHLAGHAVYTRTAWLLFHAELVAQRLYSSATATNKRGATNWPAKVKAAG